MGSIETVNFAIKNAFCGLLLQDQGLQETELLRNVELMQVVRAQIRDSQLTLPVEQVMFAFIH